MKLDDKQLDKLIEMVTESLRKRLGREPTGEEVAGSLPLFLCRSGEEKDV